MSFGISKIILHLETFSNWLERKIKFCIVWKHNVNNKYTATILQIFNYLESPQQLKKIMLPINENKMNLWPPVVIINLITMENALRNTEFNKSKYGELTQLSYLGKTSTLRVQDFNTTRPELQHNAFWT